MRLKTLKYAPAFPQRLGCLADARGFLVDSVQWYEHEPSAPNRFGLTHRDKYRSGNGSLGLLSISVGSRDRDHEEGAFVVPIVLFVQTYGAG
jgi:hypothetical protein